MDVTNLIAFQQNWQEPDLTFMMGAGELADVPPFPLDSLGSFWAEFVSDAAGEKLPRDYFAMNLLGTVSGLVGNGLEAVMPAPLSLRAPATLWAINVGQPGAGKTPAFMPFLDIVNELEANYGTTRHVEDTTIAALIRLASQTPEGLVVMNDELSGWWDTFKHDRQGEQFWLKAWNGNVPYTHHRGGRGGSSITIPRHNVAVVGGTQPATLPTMLEATGNVERGFVSRCLFSYPDRPEGQTGTGKAADRRGARDALERVFGLGMRGPRAVPVADDAAAYHAQWAKRFNPDAMWVDATKPEGQWILKQFGTAIRLALVVETIWWSTATAPDAKVLSRAQQFAAMADPLRNDNEPQRRTARKKLDALIADHGLAADGTWNPSANGPRLVTGMAMRTTCDLIENYFYKHFIRCEGSAYAPVSIKAAKDLARVLIRTGATSFNARRLEKYEEFGKVSPALHGKGAGETVEEVCEYLAARHIIRRRENFKVGRKPRDYDVNPLLTSMANRILR
jgi:hypothetical protein